MEEEIILEELEAEAIILEESEAIMILVDLLLVLAVRTVSIT